MMKPGRSFGIRSIIIFRRLLLTIKTFAGLEMEMMVSMFFDFGNKRHRVYHSDLNDAKSLGLGAVLSLYNDSQNRMWVGTNLGGLQCYNPANDNFKTYINDPQDSFSISNNDIRGMAEDAEGNFWVITHGKGY